MSEWEDTKLLSQSVRRFEKAIRDFQKRVDAEVPLVVKKIAFEALGRIVEKTPVDSGRARGNWQVEAGSPTGTENWTDEQEMKGMDEGSRREYYEGRPRRGVIARGAEKIEAAPDWGTIWLFNNVPYILRLENGWSREQAPQGMVAVTLNELAVHYAPQVVADFNRNLKRQQEWGKKFGGRKKLK